MIAEFWALTITPVPNVSIGFDRKCILTIFKVIRSIVEEKMDIQGGYAKPKVYDVLLVQLVVLPYTIFIWSRFYSRWLWKFGICREEYGLDEKMYVIRRNMKLSEGQFNVSGLNFRFLNLKADSFQRFLEDKTYYIYS